MGVAGIWERQEQGPFTCSMITTASNELVGAYLDRMPAILKPENYLTWLDPATREPELHTMLQTRPSKGMKSDFDGLKASYARLAETGQQELLF